MAGLIAGMLVRSLRHGSPRFTLHWKAGSFMKVETPDYLKRAMKACRRVWMSVALFSACLNMLMLSVPIYMMQLYDRVLATGNVDTLLALTVMVAVALLVLGLLDALRGRIMARVGAWLDRELGSPVLAGAVGAALRAGRRRVGAGPARSRPPFAAFSAAPGSCRCSTRRGLRSSSRSSSSSTRSSAGSESAARWRCSRVRC